MRWGLVTQRCPKISRTMGTPRGAGSPAHVPVCESTHCSLMLTTKAMASRASQVNLELEMAQMGMRSAAQT